MAAITKGIGPLDSTITGDNPKSLTFNGVTAGSAVVVGCRWVNGTITSVAMTGESNATILGSPVSANGQYMQFAIFPKLTAGGNKTITVTYSTGTVNAHFGIELLPPTGNDLDYDTGTYQSATGSSSGPLSVSVSPNYANDAIIVQQNNQQADAGASGSGFVVINLGNANWFENGEYQLDAGASGARNVQMTLTGSTSWAILAMAVKQVPTGAAIITGVGSVALSGQTTRFDLGLTIPTQQDFFILTAPSGSLSLSGETPSLGGVFGIEFPKNDGATTSAPMVAIKFTNPHNNGLPIWGPSDAGVTVVRKVKPYSPTTASNGSRYVAMFWWSDASNFNWDSGSPNTYWGFHTYPNPSPGGASGQYWEIAAEAGDIVNNRNGSPVSVTFDQWFTQGIRVTHNGNGTKTLVFYLNLPSTDNADVIEFTTGSSYGESNPPNPQLTIGDSPWYASYQHERFAGVQGPIKIFDIVLSESDMISEAGNFTALATSQGQSHIWWGKKSFDEIDDLTCDYSTGRAFVWHDTGNKGSIVQVP